MGGSQCKATLRATATGDDGVDGISSTDTTVGTEADGNNVFHEMEWKRSRRMTLA